MRVAERRCEVSLGDEFRVAERMGEVFLEE